MSQFEDKHLDFVLKHYQEGKFDTRKAISRFNEAHGIVPRTIRKSVREMVEIGRTAEEASALSKKKLSRAEKLETIARLEKEMKAASKMLEFEYAALLRDQIIELRKETEK